MPATGGLQIAPEVSADPTKPVENASAVSRVDNTGRNQVRVTVSSATLDPADLPADKPKVEDKTADAVVPPQRPTWLPEKFADPMALKNATVELAKKQGAPAYVIRGLEASESGQEVSDAYAEFEKKIDPNAGKPADKKVEDKPLTDEEKAAAEKAAADAAAKPPKTEEVKAWEREQFGTYVADMLDKAGFSSEEIGNEFVNNKGKLSDKTYEAFEKAGVSKTFLNAYIRGQVANTTELAEAGIKEAKDSIGGEEVFNKVALWASANMTAKQHDTYTSMVGSGNLNVAKEATRMLKGWYDQANSAPPKAPLKPNTDVADPNAGKGYATKEEMMKAFADPKYKKGDKAFHAEVEQKLKYTKF